MSSKKTIFLSDFSGLYELISVDDWGLTREILKNPVKSVCYKPKAGLSQKLLSENKGLKCGSEKKHPLSVNGYSENLI
jgi:hypothetical protein